MRTTTINVKLPADLDRAIRAEASQRLSSRGTLMRPGEVIAEALRTCWPDFVAQRIGRELGIVLEAEVVDDVPELAP